jgi:predicted Na+-dependent transporter
VPRPGRQVISEYRELIIVTAAAIIGLTVQSPLELLVRHQGIDVLLVILVFSTALNIEARSFRALPASWRPLAIALLVGITVLPAFSWLAAHLIATGHLREGVTTVGLAPCEIASLATTAMAGGDVALAGGVLIGSTGLTVALAGPILAMEAAGTSLHPGRILINLLCIVAVPLAAGILLRASIPMPTRVTNVATSTSTLSVAALVALIAAEVHFSKGYLSAVAAIVLFLIASAGVGFLVGRPSKPVTRRAILLTVSMRDFAIAAGLATAAFGASAAAPLGLYGIIVLVWGTASAGFMRARTPT